MIVIEIYISQCDYCPTVFTKAGPLLLSTLFYNSWLRLDMKNADNEQKA